MPSQPNILLILTDQQHSEMMSCAGNPYVSTPAMDSLARRGTRFNRTYCANPVCIPSRFTLFTGRMPSEIGMRGNGPPDRDQPLAESIEATGAGRLLSSAGYRCVYAGKQHLPRTDATRLGFQILTDDERDLCADQCANLLAQPQPRDRPLFLVCSLINPHDICHMAIRDYPQTDMDHAILRKCVTECRTMDKAMRLPEGVSETDFYQRYCPPLPDNHEPQEDEPEAVGDLLARRPFRQSVRGNWSAKRWRMHRWAYAKLTERVDRQIGRVLQGLEAGPNQDNTLVIFTSDHGDMDASHRCEHKTLFYDQAARVPLIASYPPHIRPGVVDDQHLVSNGLDLIPTLCDYAGRDLPAELEGQSFRQLAEANPRQAPAGQAWVKIENEIGRAIVTHDHKYMRYDFGASREQLFDLVNDPGETRNALNHDAHQEALANLRRQFDEAFD